MQSKATSDFFDALREWSGWKHEVLRKYLYKFVPILGSRHPTVYFVDGFAGRGMYGDNPPVPGSPLVAAQYAAEIASAGTRPFRLKCVNVEARADYFADLCQATAEYVPAIALNLRGTFQQRLDDVLQIVGSAPTLFFLDPFGYKGIEWSVMRRLAGRSSTSKTELIINFNANEIDQAAGWLDSHDQPLAPAFIANLDNLMPTSDWRSIVLAGHPKSIREELLTDLYSRQLEQEFGWTVRRYLIQTIDGRGKYFLLHVAQNTRGTREMSEVVNRVHSTYLTAKEQANTTGLKQTSLFDVPADVARSRLIVDLAEDIYAMFHGGFPVSFGTVQNQMALKWFGQAVGKDYREACKRLVKEGRIDRDRPEGITDKTVLVFR